MRKVVRNIVLILVIAMVSIMSLSAKTETVTLHLRATVPPKAQIEMDNGIYSVGFNASDVDFNAYDMEGNLISEGNSFSCDSSTVRLCFTAA